MTRSLSGLWNRGQAVPSAVAWEVGRTLWFNSRERVNENLSEEERTDLARIVRKRRGRPWNLNGEDRPRLVALVKKAATGKSEPGWDAVGRSLVTLLVPRVLPAIWGRSPFSA